MHQSIGPSVLQVKADRFGDYPGGGADTARMTVNRSQYRDEFIARTIAARKLRFARQEDIAKVLGMSQDTYKIYESKTQLPHYLIERFCLACGISLEWLLTGKGPGPAVVVREQKRARTKPAKRVAAA